MFQQSTQGNKSYLAELLASNDYQLPDQADIAAYLANLDGVYKEHDFTIPSNSILDDYFSRHKGVERVEIDLTSSATSLPPYEPAMRASASVIAAKEDELYGRIYSLDEELKRISEEGPYYESVLAQITAFSPAMLHHVPIADVIGLLGDVLSNMDPEAINTVKEAYERTSRLEPTVKKCIEHCFDEAFAPRLPNDRSALLAVKISAVDFIKMACHEQLDGKLTNTEGLRSRFERLKREYDEESGNLPNDHQLRAQADTINEKTLKPAVTKMMQHLQGISAGDVKPQNLCLCNGSSTHIMEVALQTLVPETTTNKNEKKKLLMFSMSWDALKTISKKMEISLIDGPVNAKALEEHIKRHILKGQYSDDLEKTRAAVREQIGALFMNIPENPLGKISSDAEMQALAKVIETYDVPVVILDEIFAAPGHRSLMTYPGMAEHCYVISGTSKNINCDRVAFGYSDNDDFAKRVSDGLHPNKLLHPIHSLGYTAMLEETPASYFADNQQQYAMKRRLVSETMKKVNRDLKIEKGMAWLEEPNYGCLGVITLPRELTDNCGLENSCQLAEYIYKLGGVKVMPIGDVNSNSSRALGVRINFSEENHMLIEAMERIGVAMQHMQQGKAYEDIKGNKYRGRPNNSEAVDTISAIAESFSGRSGSGRAGGGYAN